MVCTVCSLLVRSHEGAARMGEQFIHGACYVKYRTAEAEATSAAQVASRPAESTVRRLLGACRKAAAEELKDASRLWRACGLVSNTMARVAFFWIFASR